MHFRATIIHDLLEHPACIPRFLFPSPLLCELFVLRIKKAFRVLYGSLAIRHPRLAATFPAPQGPSAHAGIPATPIPSCVYFILCAHPRVGGTPSLILTPGVFLLFPHSRHSSLFLCTAILQLQSFQTFTLHFVRYPWATALFSALSKVPACCPSETGCQRPPETLSLLKRPSNQWLGVPGRRLNGRNS